MSRDELFEEVKRADAEYGIAHRRAERAYAGSDFRTFQRLVAEQNAAKARYEAAVAAWHAAGGSVR